MLFQLPPIFGRITPPAAVVAIDASERGLTTFISNLVKFFIVVAGLYAFLNIILAGFQFLSAGGDPKNMSQAWSKIYQTFIGLIIVAGAVMITMIVSLIIFGDAGAILNVVVYGPS